MKEPGTRLHQALLIALGAAGLAGANSLMTNATPESNRELLGLLLEVIGAALLALGLCGLLLPRAQLLWSKGLRVATQALRLMLLLGLIAVSGYGALAGWSDFREIRALQTEGQTTDAQITTIQTVGLANKTGHISYSYRVGSVVTMGQMDIARSEYKRLRMGAPLTVTYLPSEPHTYRLGSVDGGRVARRGTMLFLLVLRGVACFGIPFLYLEIHRRRLQQGKRSQANLAPA